MPPGEVVVTGIGIVSPIGIGREDFWSALCRGDSGVGPIRSFDCSGLPIRIAAEVHDFDPKPYVRHRKALKLMCRDAQLGVTAARLACEDAGIENGTVDPQRLGVVLGADRICSPLDRSEEVYSVCMEDGKFSMKLWATEGMAATFPLSFLKVLPNMIASHISIAHDARGPNNTIHQAELSGLLAVSEAARIIRRGVADVMIAGGASSQLKPFDCIRRCVSGILSSRQDDPAAAMRPFDADRDGQVFGEGAAVVVLEERRHAEARGARVLARVASWAATCEAPARGKRIEGSALRRAMQLALRRAATDGKSLGHVNSHGLSTRDDDQLEAHAIRDVVGEVPVVAAKSYFGNLGAAGGTMEMAVSVLSFGAGLVPNTLNYETPDPNCPVQVIRDRPLSPSAPSALLINWTPIGQAAAVVMTGCN